MRTTARLLTGPCAALAFGLLSGPTLAADLTVRQLNEALFRAEPGTRLDYSGKSLKFLDLAGIDFKAARLAGADMYGVDLTEAKLGGADLTKAKLDRATVRRADFSGASLRGASRRTVSVSPELPPNRADAPRFARADLTEAEIEGRLDGTDFSGADMTRAVIGFQKAIWGSYKPRSVMTSCDFTNAKLAGASFHAAVLQFSRFTNADLTGADLAGTDLSGADFTNADLTNADLSGADLDGATLKDVRGLDTVKGLATALHVDRAVR